MTPRQELVISARGRMRILMRYDSSITAHDAIESVVDDCKAQKPNTMGAAILEYYRGISETTLDRLIREVERKP